MGEWLRNTRELLRGSLWFVPGLLSAAGALLAMVLLALDARHPGLSSPWLFSGDADAAREILGIVATAAVTIAGVAFSITVVALALAASQFGSLLLANYLRNRVNQVVLGIFLATFIYCLMVIGNIGVDLQDGFMPSLSVSVSVLLGVLALGGFVAFIHELTLSIRAEHLAAEVGEALMVQVRRAFPERSPEGDADLPATPWPFATPGDPIRARATGYLQAIEEARLVHLAQVHEVVVRLHVRPGDFVSEGSVVGAAWGARAGQPSLHARLAETLLTGRVRTPTQDPEYSVHQLAQIAVRALSPAINDPYTALICIDWLETALREVVRRDLPRRLHRDVRGEVRLMIPAPGFEPMANAALNKLRHAARGNGAILLRLCELVAQVGRAAGRSEERAVLREHLERLREESRLGAALDHERRAIDAVHREALEVLAERDR